MKIEVNKYSLNPRWFVAGTKGSYENETLELVFSKEWDGLVKKVNFIPYGGEEVSLIYTEPITIPYEVMVRAGTCVFGVSGYKDTLRLLSVTGEMKVVDTVASPDNSTYVPTPDEMTQVMSIANQALEATEQAVSTVNQTVGEVEEMTESVEVMLAEISTLKETTESQYAIMMEHYEKSCADYLEIVEMKEDIDSNASMVASASESVALDRDCVESVRDQIIELNGEAISAKEEAVSAKEEAVTAKEETRGALEKTKSECCHIFSNALIGRSHGYAIRVEDAPPYEQYLNITILGGSSQSETPSRDAPSDISILPESSFKMFSKNFITTPFESGKTTVNGVEFVPNDKGGVVMNGVIGPNFDLCYSFYNSTEPLIVLRGGVKYKLSCFNAYNISIRICGENNSSVLEISSTEQEKTIRPDNDIPIYKVLGYFSASDEGVKLVNKEVYPMLEIYHDPSEFEEGEMESVRIPLPLCGVDTCGDELIVNGNEGIVSLTKRYATYSFSGKESWTVVDNEENTTLAYIDIPTPIHDLYISSQYQLCNRLPIKEVDSEYEEGIFISQTVNADGTSRVYARLATQFASSADFNSVFVSGDSLIYPTNETKIDYSDTEWGKALLEMKAHPNKFTIDCDSKIMLNYVKDINKVIDDICDLLASIIGKL